MIAKTEKVTDVHGSHIAQIKALNDAYKLYGCQSGIVFHNTIRKSKTFTHIANTVFNTLTFHVDGSDSLLKRTQAVETITAPVENPHLRLVSNVRCFTEGIDIPALDLVCFADPRGSTIDVTQCVGRVLRPHLNHDNPAIILIPVVVPEDTEDTETIIDSSDYRKTYDIITALADSDPRILTYLRANSNTNNQDNSEEGIITFIGFENHPDLLRAFTIKLIDKRKTWEENYRDVTEKLEKGEKLSVRLDRWLNKQKRYNLPLEKRELLAKIPGFTWEKRLKPRLWHENYQKVVFIIETTKNFPKQKEHFNEYQWLMYQKKNMNKLDENQRKLLRKIKIENFATRSLNKKSWFENCSEVADIVKSTGKPPHRTTHKRQYFWLREQYKNYGKLSFEQQQELNKLCEIKKRPSFDEWCQRIFTIVENTGGSPKRDVHSREYRWLLKQRRNKHKFTKEQQQKLELIPDFNWYS